jgi:succinyl-CoA synthetase beta subunit
VEECVPYTQELYLSVSIEPVRAQAVIMLSASGGVEIESIAEKTPELLHRAYADIGATLDGELLDGLAARAGLSGKSAEGVKKMISALFSCFLKYDAELAEINPVFITAEDDVIAGDGKLVIDDNSLFRQPAFEMTREHYSSDMEYEAAQNGIPYIQFDGDISLMCAGAGLTNTVYDLVNYGGGTVANYLEFGGPNYTKGQIAMELCLKNKSEVILIVTFGTIARADVIAEGVVSACARLNPDRPLVTCIRGTNEEAANEMLRAAGLECFSDTELAVSRAIELAAERRRI